MGSCESTRICGSGLGSGSGTELALSVETGMLVLVSGLLEEVCSLETELELSGETGAAELADEDDEELVSALVPLPEEDTGSEELSGTDERLLWEELPENENDGISGTPPPHPAKSRAAAHIESIKTLFLIGNTPAVVG
ncbi:MAG: hypothetical protein NC299_03890 [Lachnospiraceae bacterium]|nr:hypothetical protein [Ruminococcus sp.]MCM1274488.1 hypothetical protein [Lachnospiraceae bacterium]